MQIYRGLRTWIGQFYQVRLVRLTLENLALRQQLSVLQRTQPRPSFDWRDRWFWIFLCRCWPAWSESLLLLKPATVIRWHREGFRAFWRWRSRKKGRPSTHVEMRKLIQTIALENPTWGAPRIHGELLKLGYRISQRTISRLMPKKKGQKPGGQSWATFLENHREVLVGMDFFTVHTWRFKLLTVLVFIHHDRRRILHFAVTTSPHEDWVMQQLREAFPYDEVPRYLILDRDACFSKKVRQTIRNFGIKPLRIAYRSPWQNGATERLIGTLRRELLDHVIIKDIPHLERLLKEYQEYYHEDRTHLTFNKDSPLGREVETGQGPVIAEKRLGGLHHRYGRAA